MEIITELVQNQLMVILPIGLILGCILLFTYAIRPAKQPKFKLSSLDDRKTAGKRKKLKEKKPTVNGHVATGLTKSEKSPAKEPKKSPEPSKKEKKVEPVPKENKKEKTEVPKKMVEPHDSKKKLNKKSALPKPEDFDDGNWETVPTKADKKKKVEPAPSKKEKKTKQQSEIHIMEESPEPEVEKPVVEEIEEEIEEVSPEVIIVEEAVVVEEEAAPVIEEKKDKKKKKSKANKLQQSDDVAETTPVTEVVAPPVVEPKSTPAAAPTPSGAAFDELGDTWTEAKAIKKSKKKARRDN